MLSYTKLFSGLLTSTIWAEDHTTRIVWITMLAMANQHGEVGATVPGLARIAGVSLDECQAALAKFMSPDEFSRTPDNDGRRIAPIEGGWELLNHAKYRLLASKEQAQEAGKERVRRHRTRNAMLRHVTPCNAVLTHERDIADTDTDTKADPEPKVISNPTVVVSDLSAIPRVAATAEAEAPKPKGQAKAKAKEALMPPAWQPSAEHKAFASKHQLDLELEALGFRGHFEGKTSLSWNGRFTAWLTNQAKWSRERGGSRRAGPKQPNSGYQSRTAAEGEY